MKRRRARPLLDPRIERSRKTLLVAALDELAEKGYGGFTIESVAARSGVAKSTIYRHWPDKLGLISDAFETFHAGEGPDLSRGAPRERLERIVDHVAEIVGDSVLSACIPALIDGAERDRGLRRFHHRFQRHARAALIGVIAEGIAAGDFPAHLKPELAAQALLGVLFYRRLMSGEPVEPGQARELVRTVVGPPTRSRGQAP